MRSKLLLIISLAVLGASIAAGTAGAGSVVGVGEGGVQIDIPDGGNLDQVQALPQCSNGADDDGDGTQDMADPDCTGPLDATESETSGTTTPSTTTPSTSTTTPGGETSTTTGGETSTTTGGGETTTTTDNDGTVGPSGSGGRGNGEVDGPGIHKPGRHHGNGHDDNDDEASGGTRAPMNPEADRNPDGTPTDTNPSVTIADFGAAPIGVPNFVIDQFTIPPFLLPIYQACGTQYGIPWQVLASINRIETAFGTNLNVSTAGALGWMQFMPSTWEMYGVDANDDGRKDPYNPVDAICAAARYLKAAGGDTDLRTAIFAYNHADWYVDEVLLYANQYGKLPDTLISSLTGLTEGAHFPVAADARYADDISERRALKRSKPGKRAAGNAAEVISGSTTRRGINIYSRQGAPVVAVNDGVITDVGKSKKLGRYIVLQDAYGNRYTYAELGSVADAYPVPKENKLSAKDFELVTPSDDAAPDEPASAGTQVDKGKRSKDAGPKAAAEDAGPVNTENSRERLFAYPERKHNAQRAGLTGQLDSLLASKMPGYEQFKGYLSNVMKFDPKKMELKPLRKGSQVDRRHRPRPDRQDDRARAARPLRDPPGRPRGAEDRPEADPRRLEAARGDRHLPRRGQEPVRREQRERQPGPADVEGAADRAGAGRSEPRDLRLRPDGHQDRPDRPPRAGDARVPGRARVRPHDHLAQVRPLGAHHLGQRQRAHHRHRRRHRPDQRDPGDRPPGPGLDLGGAGQGPAAAAGDDEAAPDHQPDGLLRRRQHLRDGRPR